MNDETSKWGNVAHHSKGGGLEVHKYENSDCQRLWSLTGLDFLGPRVRNAWIKNIFSGVAEKTKNSPAGAACTLAVLGREGGLTIAHVGNAPAVLFTKHHDTDEVTWRVLTSEHRIDNPQEKRRLNNRLGFDPARAIQVSRGFGYTALKHAILREPDIIHVPAPSDEGSQDEHYLLMASSDLLRQPNLNDTEITRVDRARGSAGKMHAISGADLDLLHRSVSDFRPQEEVLTQLARIVTSSGNDSERNLSELIASQAEQAGIRRPLNMMVMKLPSAPLTTDAALLLAEGDIHAGIGNAGDAGRCADLVAGKFAEAFGAFKTDSIRRFGALRGERGSTAR